MKSQPFEAIVRTHPNSVTIDLSGEINAFAEENLIAAYHTAEAGDPKKIILNFKQVSYMNSTGIALIVGLLAQARKNHRQMVVYGLSDHYVEIFKITRLSDFMSIFPDEMSALQDQAGSKDQP